jgi:hypothetical protein
MDSLTLSLLLACWQLCLSTVNRLVPQSAQNTPHAQGSVLIVAQHQLQEVERVLVEAEQRKRQSRSVLRSRSLRH